MVLQQSIDIDDNQNRSEAGRERSGEEDYNNNNDNNNKNNNNIIIQEASWLPGSSSFSGNILHVGPFMTGSNQ